MISATPYKMCPECQSRGELRKMSATKMLIGEYVKITVACCLCRHEVEVSFLSAENLAIKCGEYFSADKVKSRRRSS